MRQSSLTTVVNIRCRRQQLVRASDLERRGVTLTIGSAGHSVTDITPWPYVDRFAGVTWQCTRPRSS